MQVVGMSFLCRLSELSLGDSVRSSYILQDLREELLLLHIKGVSWWFGHLPLDILESQSMMEELRGQYTPSEVLLDDEIPSDDHFQNH